VHLNEWEQPQMAVVFLPALGNHRPHDSVARADDAGGYPVAVEAAGLQTTSSPLTVQAGDGESIQPKVTGPVRSFGSMLASA
jgi:hypothetical protein